MGTEEGAADVGYLWGECVRYVYILRQNDTLASLANDRLSSLVIRISACTGTCLHGLPPERLSQGHSFSTLNNSNLSRHHEFLPIQRPPRPDFRATRHDRCPRPRNRPTQRPPDILIRHFQHRDDHARGCHQARTTPEQTQPA